MYLPTNAPKGTKLPIHDNSSVVGSKESGDSVPGCFNFENTGELHPNAFPTTTDDRFAKKNYFNYF